MSSSLFSLSCTKKTLFSVILIRYSCTSDLFFATERSKKKVVVKAFTVSGTIAAQLCVYRKLQSQKCSKNFALFAVDDRQRAVYLISIISLKWTLRILTQTVVCCEQTDVQLDVQHTTKKHCRLCNLSPSRHPTGFSDGSVECTTIVVRWWFIVEVHGKFVVYDRRHSARSFAWCWSVVGCRYMQGSNGLLGLIVWPWPLWVNC